MALQMPFKKEQKVLETTNALLAKLQICSYEIVFLNKKVYILVYFFELLTLYTGPLVPADFSDAVFTCAHFQKIAQISSLCNFHSISEGIPPLMHFWLLMISVLRT